MVLLLVVRSSHCRRKFLDSHEKTHVQYISIQRVSKSDDRAFSPSFLHLAGEPTRTTQKPADAYVGRRTRLHFPTPTTIQLHLRRKMLRFRLALFATLLICSKAFSISFRSDKTSALEAAKRTPSKLAFDGGKGSYETHPVQGIPISSDFVGDAALPTPIGSFRMRAYRVPGHALGLGEICVIYSAQHGVGGEDVPVRVHDQCLTAEVFGSQR